MITSDIKYIFIMAQYKLSLVLWIWIHTFSTKLSNSNLNEKVTYWEVSYQIEGSLSFFKGTISFYVINTKSDTEGL